MRKLVITAILAAWQMAAQGATTSLWNIVQVNTNTWALTPPAVMGSITNTTHRMVQSGIARGNHPTNLIVFPSAFTSLPVVVGTAINAPNIVHVWSNLVTLTNFGYRISDAAGSVLTNNNPIFWMATDQLTDETYTYTPPPNPPWNDPDESDKVYMLTFDNNKTNGAYFVDWWGTNSGLRLPSLATGPASSADIITTYGTNAWAIFDGSDDNVWGGYTAGGWTSQGSNFTVQFWFRTNTVAAAAQFFVDWQTSRTVLARRGTTAGQLAIYDGSAWQDVGSESLINDGNWHLLSWVFAGSNNAFQFYVDGNFSTNRVVTQRSLTVSDAVNARIGDNWAGGYAVPMDLDEFVVYRICVPTNNIRLRYLNTIPTQNREVKP